MEAIVKIDQRALKIGKTSGINNERHTFTLKLRVILLGQVKGHAILEARATTRLHKHAETLLRNALFGLHRLHLFGGARSQRDHC